MVHGSKYITIYRERACCSQFQSFRISSVFLYDKSDATSLCEGLEVKYCKYFRLVSEPIVIVFNPKDSVILLIQKSGEKMSSEKM